MLYCRDCGQCIHINDTSFIGVYDTSGWERASLDCETGDYIDYIDGETEDTSLIRTECDHCHGSHVDYSVSEVTSEEAHAQRIRYEIHQQEIRDSFDKKGKPKKIKEPQWDT